MDIPTKKVNVTSTYFLVYNLEDWGTIFNEEKDLKKVNDVKNLFSYGSITSNKDIYELEFEEVCENILAQNVASF